MRELRGRARRLGDAINTDQIIASSRKKQTIDPERLKAWLLEAVDPAFASTVQPGDILVAGRDFGCGSAMEVAVTVVRAAGIRAVLAESFSRTYFRNAINNGLIPIECETPGIEEGDRLRVRVDNDGVEVFDETRLRSIAARPFPGFVLEILRAGGLIPWLRGRNSFPVT